MGNIHTQITMVAVITLIKSERPDSGKYAGIVTIAFVYISRL
jgi:hypothetical protein